MVWMQAARRGRFGPTRPPQQDDGEATVNANAKDVVDGGGSDYDENGERRFPFAPESLPDDALPFIPKELVLECTQRSKPQDQDRTQDDAQRGLDDDQGRDEENRSNPAERSGRPERWIVIDNIVFDCRDFLAHHPGGEQVILSFVGEDCSWQFWRLHGKTVMEQYGRALRVGRTEGVKNRFVEPVRYVGLSGLGDDGW
ncbi:hypothetical protein AYO20_00522 [Fonsecaea nubica]|uniref:Cytochrome b5 heme-binding domain-containing protein n=1 Tax=Fonsecaea nubica TaxID=856822 RepID=A0A178DFJ0_9EURO|nr:hypothetical protein AYO20_00522 [Fonsecaea nubica]OAL40104.1 hypothetical protein AYO20_00522 [Fonsecaea nubica]